MPTFCLCNMIRFLYLNGNAANMLRPKHQQTMSSFRDSKATECTEQKKPNQTKKKAKKDHFSMITFK